MIYFTAYLAVDKMLIFFGIYFCYGLFSWLALVDWLGSSWLMLYILLPVDHSAMAANAIFQRGSFIVVESL